MTLYATVRIGDVRVSPATFAGTCRAGAVTLEIDAPDDRTTLSRDELDELITILEEARA